MAGRRVTTNYPQPPALERTYIKGRTRLDGVRRFLASEGVVPFAEDKTGVARIGGDMWLRPSATREVGNYLDLTPPAISGWQLSEDVIAKVMPLPVGGSGTIFEQFTDAAQGTSRTVVDTSNRLQLRGGSMCGGDWPWQGLLTYERTMTIEGGERIFTEPMIPIYMRDDPAGTVHIAAVLRHEGDTDQVNKWLAHINPARRGWRLDPVRVSDELPERHDEMWAILKDLGDEFLSARNPGMSAREKTAQAQATETDFRDFIETVPYRTRPLEWDLILKRLDQDGLSLGAITAYIWAKRDKTEDRNASAIVAVELRQKVKGNHLRLTWSTGRELPNQQRPIFSEQLIQDPPLLDWDDEVKVRYLLRLWEGITGVQKAAAAAKDDTAQASA